MTACSRQAPWAAMHSPSSLDQPARRCWGPRRCLPIFLDVQQVLSSSASPSTPPLARMRLAAIAVALIVQAAEVAAQWVYLPGYSGSGWAASDVVTTASLLLDLLPGGVPLSSPARARPPNHCASCALTLLGAQLCECRQAPRSAFGDVRFFAAAVTL